MPGHLADLADDHERGDAGHVADEHGLGEQVGEEAEPRDEADEADEPDGDREERRHLLAHRHAARGRHERADAGGRHQRRRRLGPDRQLPRRPEHRVDEQPRTDRPEPGDGGQPGHLGVREHLRARGRRRP